MEPGTAEVTEPATGRWGWARALLHRPVVAGLVLLAIYVGLSFLNSSNGFLGTDTGGKVATVKVMSERGDFDPDVGYWAAEWNPDASVHGLYYTTRIGDRFVNVTSLPMVLAARPLYDIGGYRAILLWPMAGAIAAAFAARALARRLGRSDGWLAFWVIGLASPLLIYAIDFWEHSLGVGLMAWGVVALMDVLERRPTWWRGALAGAAFGAAASMRTEAFVYVATSFAIVGVILVYRRAVGGALMVGISGVVGFGALYLANAALEIAVMGSTFRSGRVAGAASGGGADVPLRLKEAFVTLFSPFPSFDPLTFVLAAALAAGLVYLTWATVTRRDKAMVVAAAAIVVFIYLYRFVEGPGFVPGLVASTPLAAVGLVLGWRHARSRPVLAMALVPLPLVFYFQFAGGALPQWGGRYLLTSGMLLAAVGLAYLDRLERPTRVVVVGCSVAVTLFGLAWMVQRTHSVADTGRALDARPEEVLLSPNGFVAREFGATYGVHRWLSSGTDDGFRQAVQVLQQSGVETFGLVDIDVDRDPPPVDGFTPTESTELPFLGAELRVTTYVRDGN